MFSVINPGDVDILYVIHLLSEWVLAGNVALISYANSLHIALKHYSF